MGTTVPVREAVTRVAVEDLASHLATLEKELGEVPLIEVVRGDTVIAEMRAPRQVSAVVPAKARPMPDFMARLKAIYGDEVLPAGTTTKWIRDDRDGL
jgi:hypothetical protein